MWDKEQWGTMGAHQCPVCGGMHMAEGQNQWKGGQGWMPPFYPPKEEQVKQLKEFKEKLQAKMDEVDKRLKEME
jgi:hypothetical protein